MVKHVVIFRLTGSSDERAALSERFRAAVEALPKQIDTLKQIEVGINTNPSEDSDIVLTATLPTPADVTAYANHPAHVAAASLLSGRVATRICVDYETND